MTAPPPETFRWRSRSYLLAGAGAIFLLFAVVERDPVLVLVAVPVLVAPVAAALTAPRPTPTGDLEWQTVGSDHDVRIAGAFRTDPASAADDVTLTFVRPTSLAETAPARIEWWPGGVRFDLRWNAPRPVVERIPPPVASWRDPLGLAEEQVGGRRSELIVERYPLDLMRLGALRVDRTHVMPGRSPTRRIGATGDFFGIRQAAPNEPPRRINWRASARAGRWLANEYEVERTGELLILIDTRPTGLGPVADARFLGVARAAAIGITRAFLRQKVRVGYAEYGEFLHAVPLGSGRTQEARVRRAVLATWASTVEGPSERCAVGMRRYYPSGLSVLLLSTLGGDAAVELVFYLRRRGYPVVVLNPAWRSLLPHHQALSARAEAVALRLSQVERRMRLAAIRAYASVVDWEDLGSLGDLAYVLQQPVRRRV
ncbi:MAG TPA: DUF58 domain-containing protein [Thermoplasmata archaeon]|nr:DUF58 domain-containing protein [Thermoplasmata archaeon]